jgi:hypothetical protein
MTKAFLLKTTTQDVIDDVDVFNNEAITADKLNATAFTLPISGGGHVYLGTDDPANAVLTDEEITAYQQGLKPKGVVYVAAFMNAPADFGLSWSGDNAGTLTVFGDLSAEVPGLQNGDKVLFNFAVTTPEYSGIYTYEGYVNPNSTLIRADNFDETAEVVAGAFVTSVMGSMGGGNYPAGHGFFIRTLDPAFVLNDGTTGAIAFEHWGSDSAFSYTEGDGVNIVVDGGGAQEISLDTQYPLADDGNGAIGLNYSAPLALNGSDELTALAATDSVDGTLSSANFDRLAAFASASTINFVPAGSPTTGNFVAPLPGLAVNRIAVNQVRVVLRSVLDASSEPDVSQVGVITVTCTTKRGASGDVSLLDSTISANQYYLKLGGGTAVLKDLSISFGTAGGGENSNLLIGLPVSWAVCGSSFVIQKVQDVS